MRFKLTNKPNRTLKRQLNLYRVWTRESDGIQSYLVAAPDQNSAWDMIADYAEDITDRIASDTLYCFLVSNGRLLVSVEQILRDCPEGLIALWSSMSYWMFLSKREEDRVCG